MTTAINSHHTGSHRWGVIATAATAAVVLGVGAYAIAQSIDSTDQPQQPPTVVSHPKTQQPPITGNVVPASPTFSGPTTGLESVRRTDATKPR